MRTADYIKGVCEGTVDVRLQSGSVQETRGTSSSEELRSASETARTRSTGVSGVVHETPVRESVSYGEYYAAKMRSLGISGEENNDPPLAGDARIIAAWERAHSAEADDGQVTRLPDGSGFFVATIPSPVSETLSVNSKVKTLRPYRDTQHVFVPEGTVGRVATVHSNADGSTEYVIDLEGIGRAHFMFDADDSETVEQYLQLEESMEAPSDNDLVDVEIFTKSSGALMCTLVSPHLKKKGGKLTWVCELYPGYRELWRRALPEMPEEGDFRADPKLRYHGKAKVKDLLFLGCFVPPAKRGADPIKLRIKKLPGFILYDFKVGDIVYADPFEWSHKKDSWSGCQCWNSPKYIGTKYASGGKQIYLHPDDVTLVESCSMQYHDFDPQRMIDQVVNGASCIDAIRRVIR